jgi:alkylation response protein AidB-like acyl-CoA dehydrogenase
MDFQLTAEQQALAKYVRSFAEQRLSQGALARAHSPDYPWDVARMLAGQSMLGMTIAESDGGQGASLLDSVIVIEQLAQVCPKSADVFQAGNFGAIRTFAEYASPELRARYLPDLLAGTSLLGLGMSEPEAGSAVTDLRTSARVADGDVVLNGTKVFSTNSAEATAFLVYARFGAGTGGIGSVLVPRDAAGLSVGPPTEFLSGEVWCPIYLTDCRVPESHVVLGLGGFKRQISGFNVERIGNAARALAVGRLAFDLARTYAMQREQFGKRLCEFQGIQWKFADMAARLDAAQLLLYRAASRADCGLPNAYDTSVAKLVCNEAGFYVANESVQVMGALGYSRETLAEYALRRTRGWMIAGGSVEILRNRIAEEVFQQRFDQRR